MFLSLSTLEKMISIEYDDYALDIYQINIQKKKHWEAKQMDFLLQHTATANTNMILSKGWVFNTPHWSHPLAVDP